MATCDRLDKDAVMDPTLAERKNGRVPIAVFWDIENCSVPRGVSALGLVRRLREELFAGHLEAEFMCVCDTRKENKKVIQDLNAAQVTVVHVHATSKNAADDKLRQCMRRFANVHEPPATIVLISGDVNFAGELSDLRHRHGFRVVLVHPRHVSDALLATAHQSLDFNSLSINIPAKITQDIGQKEVLVHNLPANTNIKRVRNRLGQLAENCGGKVISVTGSSAVLRCANSQAALRCSKRLDGEDVFGNKICVALPCGVKSQSNRSPPKNTKQDKIKATFQAKTPCPEEQRLERDEPVKESPRDVAHQGGKLKTQPNHKSRKKNKRPKSKQAAVLGNEDDKKVSPQKNHTPRPLKAKQSSPGKYGIGSGAMSPVAGRYGHSQYYNNQQYTPVRSGSRFTPCYGSGVRDNSLDRASLASEDSTYGQNQYDSNQYGSAGKNVVFMPQGYQDESGRRGSQTGYHYYPNNGMGNNWQRWDSNTSPLPWRINSPKYSSQGSTGGNYDMNCHSPNFRRTPGAKRPSSRANSYGSCGGSRPSSCSSFRGSPLFYCGSVEDLSSSAFQPTSRSPSPLLSAADLCSGTPDDYNPDNSAVELMVSNLDYNISAREWKKILYAEFQQHVQVQGVRIQTQPDNTNIGFVRVATTDEARYAISQFHRKKIGYKRIHVALVNQEAENDSTNLRSEIIALLKDVAGHRLPLFKFIELFEKRYHRNMSVSELYRLRDTVEIEDQEASGRMVLLTAEISNSLLATEPDDQDCVDDMEPVVCPIHCEPGSVNYINTLDSMGLSTVVMSLRGFAPQIHTLLQTHEGDMPLMSFPACYAAEFGALRQLGEGRVFLEHLISCVPGVKIAISKCGMKKVQWAENKPIPNPEFGRFCMSPLMSQQLSQFSRETVDLLKSCQYCRLPFSRFIPAYHHHFGRQCRVADYGYTKLAELFNAIPHVVEIIGAGSRRLVTLSHRAQVKRFTSDILRVLKSQASRQISVLDLPVVYNKVIGKPFAITDYGVCYLEDLLAELTETTVLVTGQSENMVISMPKREQTPEEVERTKQFALEVIDLLKHSPQCHMPFNKFIPAYHHHFGKQCRVSDYGFTKLLELFESIPYVIQILDEQDEKMLCLTELELLKVLEEQVAALLRSCPGHQLPMPEFLSSYMKFHGHSLRLPDYGVSSVLELVEKIPHTAKVETHSGRLVMGLVDHSYVQQLAHHLLLLLMERPDGSMPVPKLRQRYRELFGTELNMDDVGHDLQGVVEITKNGETTTVKLSSLQMFARDVRTLLRQHQGKLSLQQFEAVYAQTFGVALVPASYGYPSISALLQAIPHVAMIRGRGHRQTVLLCQDFQGKLGNVVPASFESVASPPGNTSELELKVNTPSNDSGITEPRDDDERELLMLGGHRSKSPFEALLGPIPSCLPSPELTPSSLRLPDLMRFELSPPTVQDLFSGKLSEEENYVQKIPLCRTPVSEMLQFAATLLPLDRPPVPANAQHVSQLQQQMQQNNQVVAISQNQKFKVPEVFSISESSVTLGKPTPDKEICCPEKLPSTPEILESFVLKPDSVSAGDDMKMILPHQSTPEENGSPVKGPCVSPVNGSPCRRSSDTASIPGTPRRSRIAAKFTVHLSPSPSDDSN